MSKVRRLIEETAHTDTRYGLSLFELLIVMALIGALLGAAVWNNLTSAQGEARRIGAMIEQVIAIARLSGSPYVLDFQSQTIIIRGTSITSRLRTKSQIKCDNCTVEISARGVSQPATVELQAVDRCLVVIALRGRVRVTCKI